MLKGSDFFLQYLNQSSLKTRGERAPVLLVLNQGTDTGLGGRELITYMSFKKVSG